MKKPGWYFRLTGFRQSLLRALLCASILIAPATFAQDSSADIFDALQVMRLPDPPLAPAFALPDVDGGMHTLEDYRGQVVFLNFWTSW